MRDTKKTPNLKVFWVLSKENTQKVLSAIFENLAMSPPQLAVGLGLSLIQVHRAIVVLQEADLIQSFSANPTPLKSWVYYRPTPAGKAAMDLFMSERFKPHRILGVDGQPTIRKAA